MNANGEIQIRFPDGTRMTLQDDPVLGFKAFHHCGTLRGDVCVDSETLMKFDIDKGTGDEFYVSLACASCLFKVSFLWEPGSTAAMIGERIIRRSIGVFAPMPEIISDEISAHQLPPDSVREHIMRSYNI